MASTEITINDLLLWNQNKTVNPLTKRKIKVDGIKYKKFNNLYHRMFSDGYDYFDGNEKDPVTLEPIWEEKNGVKTFVYSDHNNLIMFKEDNNVFTFEKDTLEFLKLHKYKKNPITTKEIPESILSKVGIKEEIEKTTEEKAMDVFQLFTSISIFIDSSDFLKLNEGDLDKLYYETFDFFQNNIPEIHIKNIREIGQKNKKIVYEKEPSEFVALSVNEKKEYILNSFQGLLQYEDEGIKYMANYIILGGLGLVIPKVKSQYPDFSFSFI